MDPLDFYTETVIDDVLKHQREMADRQKQEAEKQTMNEGLSNLQVTVTQKPSMKGQPIDPREAIKTLPDYALWRSSVIQNYVHGILCQDRLTEPLSVGRLAVHLGVTYDALQKYLDDVYPKRSHLLINNE